MVLLVLPACVPLFSQKWTTSMKGTLDTVSKRCVLNTTGKDTAMSVIIFSILLSVTLLGAIWFHDVWLPPEGRAEIKRWRHSLDPASRRNRYPVAPLHPAPLGKEAQ